MTSPHSGQTASIGGEGETVTVPRQATDGMLMAARGLLMSLSMNSPTYGYSLGQVADSGFYGEHWAHILTEEERAISAPLTKAHRADLIWRAMVSAAEREAHSTNKQVAPQSGGEGR